MNARQLNEERVAELLKALRQRTPGEITIAMIGFGGCFTPEMWRALELLAAERSGDQREKITASQKAEAAR